VIARRAADLPRRQVEKMQDEFVRMLRVVAEGSKAFRRKIL
jgi:hypothetical protein